MNGQIEKPMQKYKCLLKPTASYMTSWSTETRLVQWLGVQSSRVEGLYWRQWWPQSHDLQSHHGSRSSHTCNTVASLPTWCTNYTCHHSHRLNEPAAKVGVWNGLPWLAHSHAQSSAVKASVDLLPLACQCQREWMGRQTGKHSRHHIWSPAWQGRGA